MASIAKLSKSPVDPAHPVVASELTPNELDGLLQLSDIHSDFDMSERQRDQHAGEPFEDLAYDPNKFRLFARMTFGQALWRFLKRPDNLVRMQTATYLKRPAVEPLSPGLLAEFGSKLGEDRIKQMIGHMVGQIMKAMGYELDAEGLRMTKPGLFSTGARYRTVDRHDGERATRMTPKERQDWVRRHGGDRFNRWLDAEVQREDGSLDDTKLQAVAERYGIDEGPIEVGANYRRLNIGVCLRERLAAGRANGDGKRYNGDRRNRSYSSSMIIRHWHRRDRADK